MEGKNHIRDTQSILAQRPNRLRRNLLSCQPNLKTFFKAIENDTLSKPSLVGFRHTTDLFSHKLLYSNCSVNCQYLWSTKIQIGQSFNFNYSNIPLLFWRNVWRYCSWRPSICVWNIFGFF